MFMEDYEDKFYILFYYGLKFITSKEERINYFM